MSILHIWVSEDGEVKFAKEMHDSFTEEERKVHILAKKLLENKKTEEALAVLCSIE